MHYIVSRNDIHDVFACLRELERSKRLREKGILYRPECIKRQRRGEEEECLVQMWGLEEESGEFGVEWRQSGLQDRSMKLNMCSLNDNQD